MVDLLVSSEQQQIIDSVVDFLSVELPLARLRPDGNNRSDSALWPTMGELGWFMTSLTEAQGGLGLSAVEEALLFRQLGRHLLTPNVLASAIGARVAAAAGVDELAAAIASGQQPVALGNAVGRVSIGARISGRFHLFDAAGMPLLLLTDGVGNAALVATASLSLLPRPSAVDAMSLHEARLDAVAPLALAGPDLGAHVTLRLLAASMLAGVCEQTRDLATDYAKLRVQFGQPIGAFQAIKHKCADLALRADAVGHLVNFASIRVANRAEDAVFQATAAKLLGAQYALINAKETIQIHGGIGFTTECDAHHFLKRAHVYDLIGGGYRQQQRFLLEEPAPGEEPVA